MSEHLDDFSTLALAECGAPELQEVIRLLDAIDVPERSDIGRRAFLLQLERVFDAAEALMDRAAAV